MTRSALLGLMLGGAAANPVMPLTLIEGTTCMDGTPAGFYYSPAPSATSTLWVIDFKGGGACYDQKSCDERAKTFRGSSKYFAPTYDASGFVSGDKTTNPDFYDSYKIHIPYCTSDTHGGTRTKADSTSFGYLFSGHTNVVGFIDALLNNATTSGPLKAATHILVTGGSAGGAGTFNNIDYIQSRLSWATVKGIPLAGFFFPGHTDDQSNPAFPPSDWAHWSKGQTGSLFESDYVQTLWQPFYNADCLKAFPSNMSWACGSVAAQYPYIKTPIFILENQYDTNQLVAQLGCPKPAHSTEQVREYIAYFGKAMRATITADYLKKGDGAFLPSCLDHGEGLGLTGGTTIPNAPTQTELVGDWYWERGQIKNYFVPDTCTRADGLPCNPTCDSVPGYGPGPSPPSPPGPGPAPPADNCKAELTTLGCLPGTAKACEDCARAHRSDLEKAGCKSTKEVGQLCGAA